jgi:DNA-binding NarL/FixJ family response regulator
VFDGGSRTAVVLDRQPLWMEAVAGVLGGVGVAVVGKATRPAAALRLLATHRPELFVTELQLDDDDKDGPARLRDAGARHPGIRIVVLTNCSAQDAIDAAFDAGAAAYVLKSSHPVDLASAIRQVFEHSVYYAGQRARRAEQGDVRLLHNLTPREREVLRLVAEGHSNGHVARALWVTEQTVKFHLSNVYRKLNVSNRTEAAHWAQVHGILGEPKKTRLSVA